MEEYHLKRSSWGRACQDTISAQTTAGFMWGGEGVLAVAGGAWLVQIAPLGASDPEMVVRAVIGALGGLTTAILIVFAWNLFRAPYKQRNDARRALGNLSQTPLKVDYEQWGCTSVGKNWRKENQYIWHFNVMLTNTSDTQPVGTKAISLIVNFSVADGDVRSYVLSLMPKADRDKYGRQSTSGEPLAENEYLLPRAPLRGFYQFLDVEWFERPNIIQAWPTLIVVDSLDVLHRKEFKSLQTTIQPKPDKVDSQT